MKNQHFGDIDDYGKISLLRFLSEQGVSVAVNWYLTPDDGEPDAGQIAYLEDVGLWKYDPRLYLYLKDIVTVKKVRMVSELEKSGLLSQARYYQNVIEDPRDYSKSERDDVRAQWHRKGLEILIGADLVYLDPDSGFRETKPKKIDDEVKYCYAGEVLDYYKSGSDVCIYSNRGRRSEKQWEDFKNQMKKSLPEAEMMGVTFEKGRQCSFFFAIHPKRADKMHRYLDAFLHTNWKDMFITEPI